MKKYKDQQNSESKNNFQPKLLIHQGNEIDSNNFYNSNQNNQQQQSTDMLPNTFNNFNESAKNLSDINLNNLENQKDSKNNSNLNNNSINIPSQSFIQNQELFQEPLNFSSKKSSEQNLRNMGQFPSANNLFMLNQNPVQNDIISKMYQDSYENLFKLNQEQQLQYIQQQQQIQQQNGFTMQQNMSQNNLLQLSQQQQQSNNSFGFNSSNNNLMGLPFNISDPNFLQIQQIKGNVKNTYIKKISSILHSNNSLDQLGKGDLNKDFDDSEDDFQSYDNSNQNLNNNQNQEKNQQNQSIVPGNTELQPDPKKQKKNRESARNSRYRKKMYIELLEKKVEDLHQKIDHASEFITKNWNQISQILQLTPYLRYLINQRHNYLQKMQTQLSALKKDETKDTEQLGMVIDSYRLRLGATGWLRKNSINFLFQHFIRSFLYNTYPYFLFGYSEDQQDEDEEYNNCVNIFKNQIGVQDQSQIYKVLPILRNLIKHRERFRNIIQDVNKIKKQYQKSAQKIETILDNFSLNLESEQIGKLINNIDKNRKNEVFQANIKRTFSKFESDENNTTGSTYPSSQNNNTNTNVNNNKNNKNTQMNQEFQNNQNQQQQQNQNNNSQNIQQSPNLDANQLFQNQQQLLMNPQQIQQQIIQNSLGLPQKLQEQQLQQPDPLILEMYKQQLIQQMGRQNVIQPKIENQQNMQFQNMIGLMGNIQDQNINLQQQQHPQQQLNQKNLNNSNNEFIQENTQGGERILDKIRKKVHTEFEELKNKKKPTTNKKNTKQQNN